MVKKYIRICDQCGKEISNMYVYGVTTLYKDIRVGRGGHFHDYNKPNLIRNLMEITSPNDYDVYGRAWYSGDDAKEFNFCSPDCLYNFLGGIYKDVYSHTISRLKDKHLDNTKEVLADLEKRKKMHPIKKFFDRSKSELWIDSAISELENLLEDTKKELKKIKSLKQKEVC